MGPFGHGAHAAETGPRSMRQHRMLWLAPWGLVEFLAAPQAEMFKPLRLHFAFAAPCLALFADLFFPCELDCWHEL